VVLIAHDAMVEKSMEVMKLKAEAEMLKQQVGFPGDYDDE